MEVQLMIEELQRDSTDRDDQLRHFKAFGAAVKELRRQKDLSEDALATALRWDVQILLLIESGLYNPDYVECLQLASQLGRRLSSIIRYAERISDRVAAESGIAWLTLITARFSVPLGSWLRRTAKKTKRRC
jgi:ribosome-binding protein aMBF1 (putative translation factor)